MFPWSHLSTRRKLGELSTVMQTLDCVSPGLHNCLKFSQLPLVFTSGCGNTENVLYCVNGIGKISLRSPIVINVPTRAPLAVKTKGLSFLWFNLLKQISNKQTDIFPIFLNRTAAYSLVCLAVNNDMQIAAKILDTSRNKLSM